MVKKEAVPTKSATAEELSPEQWGAIILLGREAVKHRKLVPAGSSQEFDVWLHLSGILNVAEGHTQTRKDKPKADRLLAVVLELLSDEAGKSLLAKLADKFSESLTPKVSEVNENAAVNFLTSASRPKEVSVSGAVTGAYTLEIAEKALPIKQQQEFAKRSRRIKLEEKK